MPSAAGDSVPASAARSVPRLLGAGYLAFTVDQGAHTERYQGIVELTGATLADCIHHYFRQSEQIEAAIKRRGRSAGRTAGLARRRPDAAAAAAGRRRRADEIEDGWRRALVLMASGTRAELLDRAICGPNDLLYRLFHEDGVRVFTPSRLQAGCRCSRERVERVIRSLPAAGDRRAQGRRQAHRDLRVLQQRATISASRIWPVAAPSAKPRPAPSPAGGA